MPTFIFSCRLGPRIEVYRGQPGPLHIEDGAMHVRRRRGHRDVPVFVRRATPSYSSPLVIPHFFSSSAAAIARPRYRNLSPEPQPQPQIIEVEPSDECLRQYRESGPVPESQPRQHTHSHFYQQIPAPVPAPGPAPAPPPPLLLDPLGERVESLTTRNALLEVEMRDLREQVRRVRRDEEEYEEMLALVRPRTRARAAARICAGGCGYLAGACRCRKSGSGSGRRARGRWVDWD